MGEENVRLKRVGSRMAEHTGAACLCAAVMLWSQSEKNDAQKKKKHTDTRTRTAGDNCGAMTCLNTGLCGSEKQKTCGCKEKKKKRGTGTGCGREVMVLQQERAKKKGKKVKGQIPNVPTKRIRGKKKEKFKKKKIT